MAYEQKDNTGSLFRNDNRTSDNHPTAKGSALIDGVEYWMDAWTNEAKDGRKYQSIRFKRKDAGRGPQPPNKPSYAEASTGGPADLDDEIPF